MADNATHQKFQQFVDEMKMLVSDFHDVESTCQDGIDRAESNVSDLENIDLTDALSVDLDGITDDIDTDRMTERIGDIASEAFSPSAVEQAVAEAASEAAETVLDEAIVKVTESIDSKVREALEEIDLPDIGDYASNVSSALSDLHHGLSTGQDLIHRLSRLADEMEEALASGVLVTEMEEKLAFPGRIDAAVYGWQPERDVVSGPSLMLAVQSLLDFPQNETMTVKLHGKRLGRFLIDNRVADIQTLVGREAEFEKVTKDGEVSHRLVRLADPAPEPTVESLAADLPDLDPAPDAAMEPLLDGPTYHGYAVGTKVLSPNGPATVVPMPDGFLGFSPEGQDRLREQCVPVKLDRDLLPGEYEVRPVHPDNLTRVP